MNLQSRQSRIGILNSSSLRVTDHADKDMEKYFRSARCLAITREKSDFALLEYVQTHRSIGKTCLADSPDMQHCLLRGRILRRLAFSTDAKSIKAKVEGVHKALVRECDCMPGISAQQD